MIGVGSAAARSGLGGMGVPYSTAPIFNFSRACDQDQTRPRKPKKYMRSCPNSPELQPGHRYVRSPENSGSQFGQPKSHGNQLIPEFDKFDAFCKSHDDFFTVARKLQEQSRKYPRILLLEPWRRKVWARKRDYRIMYDDTYLHKAPDKCLHPSGVIYASRPRSGSHPQIVTTQYDTDLQYSSDEDEGDDQNNDFLIPRRFTVSKGHVISEDTARYSQMTSSRSASELTPDAVSTNPHFTIAVIGMQYTGKSALVREMVGRGIGNVNLDASLTAAEKATSVVIQNRPYKVSFAETDADNIDDVIVLDQYDAYFVVYSVAHRASFSSAVSILKSLTSSTASRGKPIVLVSNKIDLVKRKAVSIEDAATTADLYNCSFVEVSAALHHNVDDLLIGTIDRIEEMKRAKATGKLDDINPATPRQLSRQRMYPSHFFEKLSGKNKEHVFSDLRAFQKYHK